jgi:hypothetical protein
MPSAVPAPKPVLDPAPSATSSAEAAAPPKNAVSLVQSACRSERAGYRLSLSEDGAIVLSMDGAPERRRSVAPDLVQQLARDLVAAGIGDWGRQTCMPSADTRCNMHPCFVTLSVVRDGSTLIASRSADAASNGAMSKAIARVEKLAQLWRWVDSGVEPDAAGPCTRAHECTLLRDRCRGLHAVRNGANKPIPVGACELSTQPKDSVEPVCGDDGRCALEPVDADSRRCRTSVECSAVRLGCDAFGAVRRDQLKRIAVRNDHLRCAETAGPVPRVACLEGVCVTRATP